MVIEVTLQPGYAREVPVKIVNKQIHPSRHVYNSSIDVPGIEKAPFSLWKQWLSDSNSCKPLVPGRTFADVVKQNADSCNTSAKKFVPLEATQMHKPEGMSPGSVKGANIRCTSSPQVRITPANRNTNTADSDISLFNRFAILQSVDDQELFRDSDSDRDFQCTSPCSCKVSPGNQNIACDIFDKILLKKKIDIIARAKSCDDYVRCKSQMDRPFGVIPLSPLKIYTGG